MKHTLAILTLAAFTALIYIGGKRSVSPELRRSEIIAKTPAPQVNWIAERNRSWKNPLNK